MKNNIIISICIILLLISTNFSTFYLLNNKMKSKIKFERYNFLQTVEYLNKNKKEINCKNLVDYLDITDLKCENIGF